MTIKTQQQKNLGQVRSWMIWKSYWGDTCCWYPSRCRIHSHYQISMLLMSPVLSFSLLLIPESNIYLKARCDLLLALSSRLIKTQLPTPSPWYWNPATFQLRTVFPSLWELSEQAITDTYFYTLFEMSFWILRSGFPHPLHQSWRRVYKAQYIFSWQTDARPNASMPTMKGLSALLEVSLTRLSFYKSLLEWWSKSQQRRLRRNSLGKVWGMGNV